MSTKMNRQQQIELLKEQTTALTFAGQGYRWLDACQQLYAEPSVQPFIDHCLDAVEEECVFIDQSVALPHGFPVRDWLRAASQPPTAHYPSYSALSVIMTFVTQLASVYRFCGDEYGVARLVRDAKLLTGHSQGILAAACLSTTKTDQGFWENAWRFSKFVFILGARAQEVFTATEATEDEIRRSTSFNPRPEQPSPMVALLGSQQRQILEQVRRFNARTTSFSPIDVSLRHSATNVILTSERRSLIEFNAQQQRFFEENNIRYIYIQATCPFHSAMMDPIRPIVEADFARMRFAVSGDEVIKPTYSFSDGRNLQDEDEISMGLYQDVLTRHLDYRNSLQVAATDNRVRQVLDFGPGINNARLTEHVFKTVLDCEKPVLSAMLY